MKPGNGTFPFTFFYEDARLKFDINISTDKKKKGFTLDVQERRFEVLPYRPCAISLKNDNPGNIKDLRAAIEVNDIDIMGSRKYRKQETRTWEVEAFENNMKEKLSNEPVRHIYIVISQGSSVAVNELLAAIYVNIAEYNEDKSEGGLESITIDKLPRDCELDRNLLTNIALKAKNCRVLGFRRNMSLSNETRQVLIEMLKTML